MHILLPPHELGSTVISSYNPPNGCLLNIVGIYTDYGWGNKVFGHGMHVPNGNAGWKLRPTGTIGESRITLWSVKLIWCRVTLIWLVYLYLYPSVSSIPTGSLQSATRETVTYSPWLEAEGQKVITVLLPLSPQLFWCTYNVFLQSCKTTHNTNTGCLDVIE